MPFILRTRLEREPLKAFDRAQLLRAHVHEQILKRAVLHAGVIKVGEEIDRAASFIIDFTKKVLLDVFRFLGTKLCCVEIVFREALPETLSAQGTLGMSDAARIDEI